MDWKTYSAQFSIDSTPPKELFTRFLAEKLTENIKGMPSQISLRIDHASGNHLYIVGSMQIQNQPDIIKGELVWLPKLHIFRGHVLVNPPTGYELLRQDIKNFNKMIWTKKKWQRSEHPKDDHDHCEICFQSIYETDDETLGIGHFSDGHWLCNACYEKYIKIKRI